MNEKSFEEARQRVLAREEEKLRLTHPEFLVESWACEEIDFSDWNEARLYDTLAQVGLELGRRYSVPTSQIFASAALSVERAITDIHDEAAKIEPHLKEVK